MAWSARSSLRWYPSLCGGLVVVLEQLGGVVVGAPVQEPVEALEPAPERPVLEGPCGCDLLQGREVPLADQVRAVPVLPQDLGEHRDAEVDVAAGVGEAGVGVGQEPHAHRVVVPPRKERCAGGGAQGCDVEVRVAQAPLGEAVDRRGADGRAEAAQVGPAGVVKDHHQHVGPVPVLGRRAPGGLGFCQRSSDAPSEVRLQPGHFAHSSVSLGGGCQELLRARRVIAWVLMRPITATSTR
jgi:hypothetical protein